MNYKLPFDRSKISKPAFDFVSKLCERDPKKRLGARGVEEIKNHKFFKNINWKKVYSRDLKPPFVPNDKLVVQGKYTPRNVFYC